MNWLRAFSLHRPIFGARSSSSRALSDTDIPVTLYWSNLFVLKRGRFDPLPALLQLQLPSTKKKVEACLQVHVATDDGTPCARVAHVDPRTKDGGAFVHLIAANKTSVSHLLERLAVAKLPSTRLFGLPLFLRRPKSHLVLGDVFNDDIASFTPSARLRIDMEGKPAPIEKLYSVYRRYGQISSIEFTSPASALITFRRIHGATSARNCTFNYTLDGTTFRPRYQPLLKTRVLIDFVSNHPRIVLPVVIAVLVGLAVAVFDPIHVFFMKSQFAANASASTYSKSIFLPSALLKDLAKFYKPLQDLLTQLYDLPASVLAAKYPASSRRHDESTCAPLVEVNKTQELKQLLNEAPETLIMISGAPASGKTQLATTAVTPSLVLDCELLVRSSTNASEFATNLARQLGFRPHFPIINRLLSMADSLLVSSLGTKTGLSGSSESDVAHMLRCARAALSALAAESQKSEAEFGRANKGAIPVVVLDNFLYSRPDLDLSAMYEQIAAWAGWLVEHRVAHVVVIGAARSEAIRVLESASPGRPPRSISIGDCPLSTTRTLVATAANLASLDPSPKELDDAVATVGGHRRDIDLLVQKIRAGIPVHMALTQLRDSAISEIQSRVINKVPEQSWCVLKLLTDAYVAPQENEPADKYSRSINSILAELPLVSAPPKGREEESDVIRFMEANEVLAVNYKYGRPVSARLRRPLLVAAAKHMMADEQFASTMDVAVLKSLISHEKIKVGKLQDEYISLSGALRASEGSKILSRSESLSTVERRLTDIAKAIAQSSDKIDAWNAQMSAKLAPKSAK